MSERATLPSAETVRRMAEALESAQRAICEMTAVICDLLNYSAEERAEYVPSLTIQIAEALALYRRDLDRQKPLQQQIEEMEDGNASG